MKKLNYQIHLLLCLFFIIQTGLLTAQLEYTISGQLIDTDEKPVLFANVTLLSPSDSSIITGTISDDAGKYELKYNKSGNFLFKITCVGLKSFQKNIELSKNKQIIMDDIILTANQTELSEVVFRLERPKAKQKLDKTTYYVNTAMLSASNTGIDIMQNIPGVQVDLLNNISVNGSNDIVFLVDGIERDAAYLAQIHSDKINRIEIANAPGSEYGADVTSVINVVLKKNRQTGISGHIYANIPTANDEIFSFPTAGLNYSSGNLTLYTSYNGRFSYFDIETEDRRSFSETNNSAEIFKSEQLFQENWSHKLHFGADYYFNDKNQFNIYGFVSRFSNEQSGNFILSLNDDIAEDQLMDYIKNDYDMNNSAYASVFYKHMFEENAELSFDANYYNLKSENRLHLLDKNSLTEQISHSKPYCNLLKARLNFRLPMSELIGLNVGMEQELNSSGDELLPEFNYTESISSAYFSANYSRNNLQINMGLRAEYFQLNKRFSNRTQLNVLPALHVKYSFSNGKHLLFSYNENIVRPSIFQLNPNLQTIDLYTTQKGNQDLKPALYHNFNLDYSFNFGNCFLKTGLFYKYSEDVIETLTFLSDRILLEKEIQNLGDLRQFGMGTTGSIKLHKNITINPHLRVYYVQTKSNDLAKTYHIENKQAINYESAVSAMFLMKHNMVFSFSIQYNSRQTHIQYDYHEDVLYFVSFEKKIFERLKVGITSAIPFMKEFTYQSYDISGENYSQTTEDNIQMSVFPVWFKINYNFASGKNIRIVDRKNSFEENRPGKGF